jgi:hypothetical protein
MFTGYKHVSSRAILDSLLAEGYGISHASQQGDGPWARHTVRMRPLDKWDTIIRGDSIPEFIYRASHDGASAVHLSIGLMRVICSNGMMVSGPTWASKRLLHVPGAAQEALVAARSLTQDLPRVAATITAMEERLLTEEELVQFAATANQLRKPLPDPGVLLMYRRLADAGNSLWNVLNRVQENIMRGGYDGAAGPKGRVSKVKEITSMGAGNAINMELWEQAQALLAD